MSWLWLEPPTRWRLEVETSHGYNAREVVDRPKWWLFDSVNGARSHEDDGQQFAPSQYPYRWLFEPAQLTSALVIERHGSDVILGRQAEEIRARPRNPGALVPLELPSSADVYELMIDTERGIILRARAVAGGETLADIEIFAVTFDVPIAAMVFRPSAEPLHSTMKRVD